MDYSARHRLLSSGRLLPEDVHVLKEDYNLMA
jgi:hypothetical protein